MGTQEGELSGLVPPVATTQAPIGSSSSAAAVEDDDFDPYGTGNPNIADTPRNLREHGIDPRTCYSANK